MNAVFRSLLFWLVVTSGTALIWPIEQLGFDLFRVSTWFLWSLIVVTMYALGTLVRREELAPLRQRPWLVGLGVATQCLVMPLAAWTITRIVPMEPAIAAGVIIVGCVPGAMASNVLTHKAGGSIAYSVSLTAVATLLSPLTVPTILWLVASEESNESLLKSSIRLAVLVVLPTILGYVSSRNSAAIRRNASRLGGLIASIALLWIIAAVVAANRERLMDVNMRLLLALLAINLAGYASGFAVGRWFRIPESYCRALTLEVGMQNAGLGTAIAMTLYGSAATIPTAAYTFGCMLTGTMLAMFWSQSSGGPTSDLEQS